MYKNQKYFKNSNEKFKMVISDFLTAVLDKNYLKFESYLHDELGIYAILPDGREYKTIEDFKDSQKKWFFGNTGEFTSEIKDYHTSGELGFSTMISNYKNRDETGENFDIDIYITLIFRHYEGKWYLIHDQNTILQRKSVF